MDDIGPVEYMVVAFPGSRFKGEIAPALADLVESQTIRIIDLAFVAKGEDGEVGAFEISDLVIQYVYREVNSGDLHVEAGPLREDGNPARNAAIGGEPVELVRLQVALASQGRALGGDVTRNYLSQVELAANPSFSIKAVATCN